MSWKLLRTKVGFADDADFVLDQSGYPESAIFSNTGPRLNAEIAFFVEFYQASGAALATRGEYSFTVFERAVYGDPKTQYRDIDGPSGTATGFQRVVVEGFNLEAVLMGVRLYDITPPVGAIGMKLYAAAYQE